MRRFLGPVIMLLLWGAATAGLNVWFAANPEESLVNAIVSGVYMLFLLLVIPSGLPMHSRLVEVLLMLYALGLGVLDVATFLNMDHPAVNVLGPVLLAPFQGLFYFEDFLGMGSFAIYAAIGCFAAFLTLAAGVGACMVQPRE